MATGVNPIVSGLLHGFELASNIKHQRLQQQALDRQVQRDEEDKQVRDLQTRMSLSDRGYRPSTPDQDAEALTGYKMQETPGIIGGLPAKSDIKSRMVDFQGSKYVRPSDDELVQRHEASAEREFSRKIRTVKATADAKAQAKTAELKSQFDQFSTPLTDEKAAAIGVAPGTRIMQGPGFAGELGAVARAGNKPEAKTQRSFLTREGGGNVTSVMTDGTVKVSDKLGLPDPAAKVISPGQQANLDLRKKQEEDRVARQRVTDQNNAQKQINTLNAQEQKFHAENRLLGERALALGSGKATDKKGKAYVPDAQTRDSDLAAIKARIGSNQSQVKALQDQQHAIIMKFAGAPANPYLENPY